MWNVAEYSVIFIVRSTPVLRMSVLFLWLYCILFYCIVLYT